MFEEEKSNIFHCEVRIGFSQDRNEIDVDSIVEEMDYYFESEIIDSTEIVDYREHDSVENIIYVKVRFYTESEMTEDDFDEELSEMDYDFEHKLISNTGIMGVV